MGGRDAYEGRGGRDVSAGGAASGCDLIGVDAEFVCVTADPSDGGAAVRHAGERIDAMAALGAVLGADCNHAAQGEVARVWVELVGVAAGPSAAKEEDDCGALVGRFPVGGLEDVEGKVVAGDLLVNDLAIGGEVRLGEEKGWEAEQRC